MQYNTQYNTVKARNTTQQYRITAQKPFKYNTTTTQLQLQQHEYYNTNTTRLKHNYNTTKTQLQHIYDTQHNTTI